MTEPKYVRTTISLPAHILEIGQTRAAKFRLSFSEFIARLVEEEARTKRSTMAIIAEDDPGYPVQKSRAAPRGKSSG